ncbi:MAG: DMT family transporter [Bdellovibrionales bacterium]|nr:DMT family transporter [Bdellovibrionales bacterium]
MSWFFPSFIALLLWTVWGILPKFSTHHLSTPSVFVYQSLGGLAIGFIVLASIHFKPEYHPQGALFAFFTGAVGFAGGLAYVYAITKGPLPLISVTTALYPGLVVLISYFAFNEPLTLKQAIGIALGFISVLLMCS